MQQNSRCPNCGAPTNFGQRFCYACGTPLSIGCPYCRADIGPGVGFCTNCGADLRGRMSQQPGWSQQVGAPPAVSSRMPSTRMFLIVLVAVFLVGICSIVYWQFGLSAKSKATIGPQISGISAKGVGSTSATITWQTDVPASSQIEYGKTTKYGGLAPAQPKNDPTLGTSEGVTSHSVLLTGLTSSTTYHFRVRSKDTTGNEAVSIDDKTFKTATPGKERYNPDLD